MKRGIDFLLTTVATPVSDFLHSTVGAFAASNPQKRKTAAFQNFPVIVPEQ